MKAKIFESWGKSHWETSFLSFILSFRAVRKVGAKSDLVSYHFVFSKSIDHKYCDAVERVYVT